MSLLAAGLALVAAVLAGALGTLLWVHRDREGPAGPMGPVDEDPPGLEEPTLPGPIPPRDYLEEVTRAQPVPVPDDPDDPHADERRVDGSNAALDEWERIKTSLDDDL